MGFYSGFVLWVPTVDIPYEFLHVILIQASSMSSYYESLIGLLRVSAMIIYYRFSQWVFTLGFIPWFTTVGFYSGLLLWISILSF